MLDRQSPAGSVGRFHISSRSSRRGFLRAAGLAAPAFLLQSGSSSLAGQEPIAEPVGRQLIVRSATPLNAEPALPRLVEHWITPTESFYVRNHGPVPPSRGERHELVVEGLVSRPVKLSLAELTARFPLVDQTATLTCAGNRRDEFTGPKISGVPWGAGAIGNARWTGVALRDLLRDCGPDSAARHVWFEGADEIVDKSDRYPFGGSIPLAKALVGDDQVGSTLLATHMNDRPLTAEHGAPLRAVVPGFIGARSVKWLNRIVVSDRPSPNHYMAHAYKLIQRDDPAEVEAALAILEYALNSVTCELRHGGAGSGAGDTRQLTARGFALPGGQAGRRLTAVETSTDDGLTWAAAQLTSPRRDFCWSLWSAEREVPADARSLLVRATDSSGEVQPMRMDWNVKGYQFNAWHRTQLS